MTAYPMLTIDRARIVNEAVAVACTETGYDCEHPFDTLRWWDMGEVYIDRNDPRFASHPARQP